MESFSDSALLIEAIIESCRKKHGIEDAFAVIEDIGEAEMRYANNGITTNGERMDREITLAVVTSKKGGQSVGIQSISTLSGPGEMENLLEAALASAKSAETLALTEIPLGVQDRAPISSDGIADSSERDFYDPSEGIELEVFGEVLAQLRSVLSASAKTKDVASGFLSYGVATTYAATTAGIRFRGTEKLGTFELVKRRQHEDRVASVWEGKITKDFKDIFPLETDADLSRRLAWSKKRTELPPGRYEVIMPPSAVADLMIELYAAADAKEVCEGGTVFSNPQGDSLLGKQIGQPGFSLCSDPYDDQLSCKTTFVTTSNGSDTSIFDNGAGLQKTYWLRNSTVENLRCSRAGAKKYGISPAFHIDNLILTGERQTLELEDMIKSTRRGLLITCLWYMREVDRSKLLITGLTRDGVYLVENGEITAEVNNFRFNDSPVTLLDNALEISRSVACYPREWGEWMPMCKMPALKVAEFNFDSTSRAN